MKNSRRHVSFEQLADLAEGRGAAENSREVSAHLDSCALCSGRLAEVSRVTSLMRADSSEDAPPDVLMAVISTFRPRPAREGAAALLRRVVASLSFDSNALKPAFGVRSGQPAPSRQLLFSAGDAHVDLRLAPAAEGWVVSGQLLGDCGAGRVELQEEKGVASVQADLNELCEFTLPSVPAGRYALRVETGDLLIEITDLDLSNSKA